jgi:hypothetical protein
MSEENQALQRQLLHEHAKEFESLQVCLFVILSVQMSPLNWTPTYFLFSHHGFVQHFCHGYETLKGSWGLHEPFSLV